MTTEHIPGVLVTIVNDEYTSFVKREPVVLTGLVTGGLGGALTGLAAKGVISPLDASTLTASVSGSVVLGVLALQGFLVRRFVAPAWKKYAGSALPVVEAHERPSPRPHD